MPVAPGSLALSAAPPLALRQPAWRAPRARCAEERLAAREEPVEHHPLLRREPAREQRGKRVARRRDALLVAVGRERPLDEPPAQVQEPRLHDVRHAVRRDPLERAGGVERLHVLARDVLLPGEPDELGVEVERRRDGRAVAGEEVLHVEVLGDAAAAPSGEPARDRHAVLQRPELEHRQVEALAVEGHERGAGEPVPGLREERGLVAAPVGPGGRRRRGGRRRPPRPPRACRRRPAGGTAAAGSRFDRRCGRAAPRGRAGAARGTGASARRRRPTRAPRRPRSPGRG